MKELCLQLLLAAAQYAGYTPPDFCPTIEFAPAEEIQRYICPGRECPAWGLFIYDSDRLLIEENRDPEHLLTRAVIVHELVHFLQDLAGETRDRGCKATLLRERVAFWAQEQYLRANGLSIPLQHNMAMYQCEEEAEG